MSFTSTLLKLYQDAFILHTRNCSSKTVLYDLTDIVYLQCGWYAVHLSSDIPAAKCPGFEIIAGQKCKITQAFSNAVEQKDVII